MTADQRTLVQITLALKEAGIDALVMGGHAVRYYGVDRNTVDFDFVSSATTVELLGSRLAGASFFSQARAQPVWRHADFARFEFGRLPDGREQWIEFWLRNHLLPEFKALASRAEIGEYGGGQVPFIALSDLLKSKETERESDWQDIALLEEIQDARNLGAVTDPSRGEARTAAQRLLSSLRSRRGMSRVIDLGLLMNQAAITDAIASCSHPATFAFLTPLAADVEPARLPFSPEAAALAALRATPFASPKHFALVEILRRAYKRRAMDLDRADKQSKLEHLHHDSPEDEQ